MTITDKRKKEITDQSSPNKVMMKNDKFCEKIDNKHVISEGQKINLNPCQNSNSRPPKHWVYTLSTELGTDSQRARPFRRFIMNQVYMFESLLSSVDRAHTQCLGRHLWGRQGIFFVPHS